MIGDLLRDVRLRNGLSVRALAREAGVSPATIDRLEHGRVSPTRSVDTVLDAIGYRLMVSAERTDEPPLTREDRRSLAFHRIVARRFLDDPVAVRAKARNNLTTMRRENSDGSADRYFDRWGALLRGSEADLVGVLLRTDDEARSLRQVTPFAGVLTPEERARVYPRRNSTDAA
ncbi:helix-turn-helix domain-containing protein [Aquihabitans daechungensis]|uniref:helix-turn-helix domain-containing protein n=1 Tax=Aquihabitans daechungensis TaxID=1052257 RepID=UPI003B9DE2BF